MYGGEKKSEVGNAIAQNAIGICYSNGTGIADDKCEAIKWYKLAAEAGDAAAQVNLGSCFATGTGLGADKCATGEAIKWITRAVASTTTEGATLAKMAMEKLNRIDLD